MAKVVRSLSDSTYHEVATVSSSFLTAWKENALHALWERANKGAPTEAQRIGSLVHCAILEPERFGTNYICAPKLDLRKTADKERKAELEEEYGAEFLVKQETWEQVVAIQAAALRSPKIERALNLAKERELSIFWEDPETKLDCKARIDAMADGVIFDLKTTTDASEDAFQAAIYKYGYHRQGAMYLRACKAAGLDIRHYSIIAIEKEAPFGANVFSLADEAIHQGEQEISDLIKQVKLYHDTGIIPGYSSDVIVASLPDWAWRKIENEGVKND